MKQNPDAKPYAIAAISTGALLDVSHSRAPSEEYATIPLPPDRDGAARDVEMSFDEHGRLRVESMLGDVAQGEVLVKMKDGGIRTVTPEGELVLATKRELKKAGFSKQDIAAHQDFAEAAKDNPALLARQGVADRPKVQPQEAAQAPKTAETLNTVGSMLLSNPNMVGDLKSLGGDIAKFAAPIGASVASSLKLPARDPNTTPPKDNAPSR